LNLPIFHIGFFKSIEILKIICKNYSRVILNNEDRNRFRNNLNKRNRLSSIQRKKFFKKIINNVIKLKFVLFVDHLMVMLNF
jgi:DNA-directed RNA polymerase beta' subunit